MKQKRIYAVLAILLMYAANVTGAITDSLVSNYGNWQNLTHGYIHHHGNNQKMEVQIDGNFIHVCWWEPEKNEDGENSLWYRRSTDRGVTWESARVVTTITNVVETSWGLPDGSHRLMRAQNGRVHFAVKDMRNGTLIRYIRSDDNGATFQEPQIIVSPYSKLKLAGPVMIDCDGEMVVISTLYQSKEPWYPYFATFFVSNDHGQTFEEYKMDEVGYKYQDLVVSNGRFAALHDTKNGSFPGEIYVFTFEDGTVTATQVAPTQSDEKVYASMNVMLGSNGDSYNYHPQMAITGNTIHLMYKGLPEGYGKPANGDAYNHTLYQKSDDFGKSWSPVCCLPESNGGHGTLVAKDQSVYILTTAPGNRRILYYSHDNGTTWNLKDQFSYGDGGGWDANRYYSLFIAPDDPTGRHVYFTGNRYFFAETKDGFQSVSKRFVLGNEAFKATYYHNNNGLMVLADETGQEHWFMQYANEDDKGAIYQGVRHIGYRRPQPEPIPSTEAALDLSSGTWGVSPNVINNRVVIPMTPSLNVGEAMTVEMWVYVDSNCGYPIATLNTTHCNQHSEYGPGWSVQQYYRTTDGQPLMFTACFNGGDKRVDVYGGDRNTHVELNKWHHVALTYDSRIAENNLLLYVDGELAGKGTGTGPVPQSINPITLGTTQTTSGNTGLLDNFAIWSRALTADEIKTHASNPQAPDASSADCRLLLTFDGTLKDQSQYGNDGVALLDCILTEHDGIVPSGIMSVTKELGNHKKASTWYNIDGRRLNGKPTQKGLYINDGKKVVIR